MVNEFFIMRPFRGKKIGEYALTDIFNRFRGKWLIYTTPTDKNLKTIQFWRKTLSRYTNDQFVEADKDLEYVGQINPAIILSQS